MPAITMRRFGRKLDVDRLRAELPITPFFFDTLYIDGQPLVDDPLARRVAILDAQVVEANRVPRLVTGRHFLQEDSGPEIANLIVDFLKRVESRS